MQGIARARSQAPPAECRCRPRSRRAIPTAAPAGSRRSRCRGRRCAAGCQGARRRAAFPAPVRPPFRCRAAAPVSRPRSAAAVPRIPCAPRMRATGSPARRRRANCFQALDSSGVSCAAGARDHAGEIEAEHARRPAAAHRVRRNRSSGFEARGERAARGVDGLSGHGRPSECGDPYGRPPCHKSFFRSDRIACIHMSGLLMRSC